MTTYNHVKAIHQTLAGTTADRVDLLQPWDGVEVTNVSGTTPLTVVFSFTAPTPGQAGSEIVLPGDSKLFNPVPIRGIFIPGSTNFVCHAVGIVGNGNAYSVVGVN